ncbi:ATP-binding protein [Burkholderia cenocepacia]|uniref:ATP-binding protein n=1 Tax=Burkholderia cenocepacia TaxID=95486 RepID=UPI00285DE68A|nr:ATP-binding protein [Burkholderia cenocepacia]MDR8032108.1 ATP-binding protein [Burkholderia cenocepacia]
MVTSPDTSGPLVAAHIPRDHPVVTRDYSLFTIAIHDMAERIGSWLDDQVDGATIFGPSRFGKSSAVDHWLQRLLSERHGGFVPLVIWSHTDSGSSQAVGSFYAHLLEASGHWLAQARRSPMERQTMLIERWIELAAQGGGRFLVLVIDEAQGMSQREWLWLVELHSLLEKQRIRLCVFSIASLQFFDEPFGMALAGSAHVAARFMLAAEPFHGVRTTDELAYVMRGYDEGSEWPPGSGRSFTAGLAPRPWAGGLRMEHHAGALMQAMLDRLPPRYAGPIDFPMKTVAQSCRHILLRIAGGADVDAVTTADAWRATVDGCGHRELMALVSATAALRGAHTRGEGSRA